MKKLLIAFCTVMLFLNAGRSYSQYLFQASAIAPTLAARLGVQEAVVRSELKDILHEGWTQLLILNCAPWLFMIICLTLSQFSQRKMVPPGNAPAGPK